MAGVAFAAAAGFVCGGFSDDAGKLTGVGGLAGAASGRTPTPLCGSVTGVGAGLDAAGPGLTAGMSVSPGSGGLGNEGRGAGSVTGGFTEGAEGPGGVAI